MIDIVTYEEIVDDLSRNRSDRIDYNSGFEQAMIVMERMFLSAEHEVTILTGKFDKVTNSGLGERFLSAFRCFLLKNGKVNIILNETTQESGQQNLILNFLRPFHKIIGHDKCINVWITDQKCSYKGFDVHFMVADSSMYRLEYDTENYLAEFTFNGQEKSNDLLKKFEDLKATSKPFDFNITPASTPTRLLV